MDMNDYPKSIKRQLRALADLAYERELKQALSGLAGQFDAWKQDRLSSSELSDLIHRFDSGVSRDLYKQYNSPRLDLQVAYAIVQGVLNQEDVPAEVWPYLQNALRFYQGLERDTDAETGERE